ncbi:MAG: hypothetical protein R3C56_09160 [Pirellulaceae bacterium]
MPARNRQFYLAGLVDHHIPWLQVSVNDALRVGVGHRQRDVTYDGKRKFLTMEAFVFATHRGALAVNELHGDVMRAFNHLFHKWKRYAGVSLRRRLGLGTEPRDFYMPRQTPLSNRLKGY